jgi:hypothetical protein
MADSFFSTDRLPTDAAKSAKIPSETGTCEQAGDSGEHTMSMEGLAQKSISKMGCLHAVTSSPSESLRG